MNPAFGLDGMYHASQAAEPPSHFGRRGGGGRRNSGRVEARLSAVIRTLVKTRSVSLCDVSMTGAQLTGGETPKVGEDLFIRIGLLDLFAKVVWSRGDLFGIMFDEPLTSAELAKLRDDGRKTQLMRLTPEQREAWEQWVATSR